MALRGMMMEQPLLISSLIDYAAAQYGDVEIVSRSVEGPIHRTTYADAARRSRQLAQALLDLGIAPGDRVATLAWNTHRHFELYYGVSGMGGVCHPRPDRLHRQSRRRPDHLRGFDFRAAAGGDLGRAGNARGRGRDDRRGAHAGDRPARAALL
jgi:acyl-CoA synthetase (AMP-forming)/AMP-acid ligase II